MLPRDAIARRLAVVEDRLRRAAAGAGRDPADITLVAVTKTWPAPLVVAAFEAGLRHFGENRAEELAPKRAEVAARLGPEAPIVWHLIGTLQSRKTDLAAANADVFHALDRLKIARRLSRRLVELDRVLPLMVEVNLSGESSKAGLDCRQWETDAAQRQALLDFARAVRDLPGLRPAGLMTMTPWQAPANEARAIFDRTAALAAWLRETLPDAQWRLLSMGMTDDFELAVAAGATHVRVGRALFGERR